ncbi:unnamed protein product [Hermetia illucens]|uniref:UPF3 domain-containing protein n=1 Tax=Hermetia illucens TaxID=343691 RepID=A0A7R8UC53_HERIL|nr:regulator of nonsense transcripts 3B isoform X2 [Hermetia illucens]CAD7078050.1 unnamed protein product [Hermetia illucens]
MTEETSEKLKNSEKSSKSRDKSHKWDKVKVLKKVVIRRLPPSMTEETFLKQIEPLPDHENYYFVPADWSLGQDATARAYINFLNQDDIFLFKDRFDGYVFVDNKGAEYPAIVEFAPFQGLPRNKSRKKDPKVNSIETDPHYISFLETLNKEESEGSKAEFKLEYSFQLKDDKKITSTPLLQYLANKKQERRDERKRKLEEKRRLREEERQRKKNLVSKNIPQAITEEEAKEEEKPKEKSTEKKRDRERTEERKEARNRRRDQKRKEEREKNRNKSQDNRSENNPNKSEKARDEDDKKKKDIKKYSLSRREKQRSRDGSNTDRKPKDSSASQPGTPSIQNVTPSTDKLSTNDGISESVKEFIKSVASCKEFIPRNREIPINSTLEGNKSVDTEDGLAEVRSKLEQLRTSSQSEVGETKESLEKVNDKNDGNSGSAEKEKEEKNPRRIRNKDRPSIEIYQPRKMRIPSLTGKDTSGRSSTELKDYRSNPTSDCESIKMERDEKANAKRKVSRYSERRSDRAKGRMSKDRESKDVDVPQTKQAEPAEEKGVDVKSES